MSNNELTIADKREVDAFKKVCEKILARAKSDPDFVRAFIQHRERPNDRKGFVTKDYFLANIDKVIGIVLREKASIVIEGEGIVVVSKSMFDLYKMQSKTYLKNLINRKRLK